MKKNRQFIFVLFIALLVSACTSTNVDYVGANHEINVIFDNNSAGYGPYITIEIEGNEYQAFFDTGDYNGGIILPIEVIKNLGLEKIDTQKSMRVDIEVTESDVYNLPQMLIGDTLLVHDIKCGVEISPNVQEPVIIGMESFKDTNMLISYKKEKIYLWEENYLPDFLSEWTKLTMVDSNIYEGIIDGNTYTFCLDTGSYGIYRNVLHDVTLEKKFENQDIFPLSFELGGKTFTSNFMYVESPYADIIGIDFFLGAMYFDYDIFIDFDESVVYIEN